MPKGDYKIVRSNSRPLRYSMYDFIEAVKQHPLLWNRNYDGFHVRERRECAWNSVARELYKGFESATPVDKKTITLTLSKRWKNARDIFFRVIRHNQNAQNDCTKMRTYIYEKEMNFLLHQPFKEERINSRARSTSKESSSVSPARFMTARTAKVDTGRHQKKVKRAAAAATTNATINGGGDGAIGCGGSGGAGAAIKEKASTTSTNAKKRNGLGTKPASSSSVRKRRSNCSSIGCMQRNPSPSYSSGIADLSVLPTIQDADYDGENAKEDHLISDFETSPTSPTTTKRTDSPSTVQFVPGICDNNTPSNVTVPDQTSSYQTFASRENPSELQMFHSGRAIHSSRHQMVPEEFDSNQLFFDSIKPVIRDLSVENRLDFQIEVLRLLKRYTTSKYTEH